MYIVKLMLLKVVNKVIELIVIEVKLLLLKYFEVNYKS